MKLLIKPSLFLGAIVGAAFGVILSIPLIQAFACFLYVFIGAGIVVYLKRNSLVGILTIHDGAFIGALSGFAALVASAAIYLPTMALLNLIFRTGTGLSLFSSFWVTSYSLFVIPMIVAFIAFLSALFNAFSGLVAAYIYEMTENNPMKEEGEILIDQE